MRLPQGLRPQGLRPLRRRLKTTGGKGLGMDAQIQIASGTGEELAALGEWLGSENELRGRVRTVRGTIGETELGAVTELTERTQDEPVSGRMTVVISPGTFPVLLQTLRGWVASGPNRRVVIEALRSEIRERLEWQGGSPLLIAVDGLDVRLVSARAPTGGVSVTVPTSPLPIWAGPQAVALAAWLTAVLTLIAVILAAATLAHDQGPAPSPVQIVIVTPHGP